MAANGTDARRDALVGVAAGLVGTTVMTITLRAEQRLRRGDFGPVDYDASPHVVTAAARVVPWRVRTAGQRRLLFLAAHWGYGSFVGVGYPPIRRVVADDRRATALYYAACQAMACTLFPTLGGTPPPWQWRRAILVSSLAQHAVYAVTVAAVSRRLRVNRPGSA